MLGNVAGCRQVFERWMEWEPDEQAWHSYINFELRYKEIDRARKIHEKYILLLLFCVDICLIYEWFVIKFLVTCSRVVFTCSNKTLQKLGSISMIKPRIQMGKRERKRACCYCTVHPFLFLGMEAPH